MSPQKQHAHNSFKESPFIFTQLGLVLALIIVFFALEYSSSKTVATLTSYNVDEPTLFTNDLPDIVILKKELPKKQINKRSKVILDPIIKKDKEIFKEKFFKQAPEEDPMINIGVLPNDPEEPIEEGEPIHNITFIEEAPVYPGCEGLSKTATKTCFTKAIQKFVNKKFDTSLAEKFNITGKQRIFVQFIIDETGQVSNIKARSPFIGLENEARRVVEKLPKMTPGKQHNKPVKVKYSLPIVFIVNQ